MMSVVPKTLEEFKKSLDSDLPVNSWPLALKAMWWDFKNNWEKSHDIAQELNTEMGSWIHGYLHRKEGDRFNANYWYGRIGKPYPSESLQEEQDRLVKTILGDYA
ncbi:hypothetical protein [Zeaxanthinibacter enoshimensis]|uniref:Uncharacterized protein n=1 Tax=Zeaxanthinibacter enoshimensis TaxID=392009 RepID=A0A4R6TLP1_9FLAO|nr:hypothetical protein [Zeaxanthinibacter enoshimensis]TDQ31637.1 hypothetical protein CLV82_2346 [Zeaxanthinibacter enoshimensis]